jgi:hypothetical protein
MSENPCSGYLLRIYLLHQPYVIYFGLRMRDLSMPLFVLLALGIIAIPTVVSIIIEKGVNSATNRVLAWLRGGSLPALGAKEPATVKVPPQV